MRTLTLTRLACLTMMVGAMFPNLAFSAVAKIEFTTGAVSALGADGRTRDLVKGSDVEQGDTLKTLDGRAQVKFSDGGYISLQPYTDFKVEEYAYNGKEDGSEKGVFKLFKGGLRAITGAIGHVNKQNYKVATPTATIGIRGTEYLATQNGDTLNVYCGGGAVVVQNDAGSLVLYQGQSGVVGAPTQAPQQSAVTPSVTAASPTGNVTEEVASSNTNTQTVYVDGNVRLGADSLCQTGDGSCTEQVASTSANIDPNLLLQGGLANIALLNNLQAIGTYSADRTITFAGSTANVTEFLGIDFASYTSYFEVDGQFVSGALSGGNIYIDTEDSSGNDTGLLNPNTGAITFGAFTGYYDNSTVQVPLSGSASGQLSSTNISQATVTYTFSDGSNTLNPITTTLSGVAGVLGTLNTDISGIANLNNLAASAIYNGTSSFALQGTTFSNLDVLQVDFFDYTVNFNSTGTGDNAGFYANHTSIIGASGSLNPSTGSMSFSSAGGNLSFFSAFAALTVTANGQLNTSNISQATVNYTVTDPSSASSSATSTLTGTLSNFNE